MHRLLLSLFTVLLFHHGTAQHISSPADRSRLLFTRKHLSLSTFFGFSGKAGIEAGPNNYNLGSSRRKAFGFGLNYHKNFSRELSLITGIHAAAPIRNFEYRIPASAFTPPLSYDLFNNGSVSETVVFVLRLPLTLEGRWFTGDKKYFYLNGGGSLNFSFINEEVETHYFIDANNRATQYLNILIPEHNNGKPWLNLHAGAGKGWLLKNKDIISAGLIANLSFTKFINGDFYVLVAGQTQLYGQYSFKGSWAGLSFNYINTGSKKKWKKLLTQL